MEERYLIIAGDFTGVSGTEAQLKRKGYPTEVLFAGRPVDSQKSIVIDTESRNVLPGHAYEVMRHSLEQVDFGQFRYIVERVDSTMRGNIVQEIKTVDGAFYPELVVLAPTFSVLDRTTMGRVQYLSDAEICKTESFRDPKNPVVEDNLVRLLGQVYEEPVLLEYLPDVRSQSFSLDRGRILACDAKSDDDLERVIATIRQDGRRALYVGAVGMADGMTEPEKSTLLPFGVVTSISSMANEQMHCCERTGYTTVKMPVARLMAGTAWPEEYRDMAVEYLKSGRGTILLTDTTYDRELTELSQEVGEKNGIDLIEVGDYVHSLVGRMTKEVPDSVGVSGVYLTGGDMTLGILINVGANGSEILTKVLVSAPLVRAKGGAHERLKLVTKAGAFGIEDAAAFAMRKMKEKGGI